MSTKGPLTADFVAMRVPLLSVDTMIRWGNGALTPQACAESDETLTAAIAADRAMLRKRLAALIQDEQVMAAISVASPDLEAGVDRWRTDPNSRSGRSVERSLVRYLTRMASRPSPFGLASGYLLGEVHGDPALRVGPREAMRVVARIDPGLLQTLVRDVAAAASTADGLLVRRNPLLYRVGGQLRLVGQGHGSNRPLVAVRPTSVIEEVLTGTEFVTSIGKLVARLERQGHPAAAVRELVAGLLAKEILIPARQVAVTGADPTAQALAALRATPGGERAAATVTRAAEALDDPQGTTARLRTAAATHLEDLPIDVDPRRCVQVDTIRTGSICLPRCALAEIHRAVDLLARVAPARRDPLSDFRERFERRFGTRPVPLMEALDPDFGVRIETEGDQRIPAGSDVRRQTRLLALLERGRSAGGDVELTDADVHELSGGVDRGLPSSLSFTCSLEAGDLSAVLRGDFDIVAPFVMGPSSARLFGRFCHGDAELTSRVRRHLEREAATEPDAIFAEVAAAPGTDAGLNVTHRPLLRDWEIECGAFSGAAPDARLEPSDLCVAVEDGAFVLRSQRLGRRVHPRFATAMSDKWLALPAARFLSLLARHEGAAFEWSWDGLASAPALPRIRRGKIVLARRCWNITAAELGELQASADAAGFRRLRSWLASRGIDRFVTFEHPHSSLLVDFDNVLSIEAFLDKARRLDAVRLVETSTGRGSPVEGQDGRYIHELVVAFTRAAEGQKASAPRRDRPHGGATAVTLRRRRFEPGSEWLFAKLYGPPSAADRLLTGPIADLHRRLLDAGLVDRWFFIRYSDPDRHLRVRFHGRPRALLGEVLPALHGAVEPALETGDLYRISIDTYEREVERYGGIEGVELMEEIAQADSEAVLALLPQRLSAVERRLLAVMSVAALYAAGGLDLSARERCSVGLRAARSRDFKSVLLAKEERAERAQVAAAVASLGDTDQSAAVRVLRARSERLAPTLERVRALEAQHQLERPFEEVIGAHAHMAVNRLLRDGGGFDELRVHDALARLYASVRARKSRQSGRK